MSPWPQVETPDIEDTYDEDDFEDAGEEDSQEVYQSAELFSPLSPAEVFEAEPAAQGKLREAESTDCIEQFAAPKTSRGSTENSFATEQLEATRRSAALIMQEAITSCSLAKALAKCTSRASEQLLREAEVAHVGITAAAVAPHVLWHPSSCDRAEDSLAYSMEVTLEDSRLEVALELTTDGAADKQLGDFRMCPPHFFSALHSRFADGAKATPASSQPSGEPKASTAVLGDFRACPLEFWHQLHQQCAANDKDSLIHTQPGAEPSPTAGVLQLLPELGDFRTCPLEYWNSLHLGFADSKDMSKSEALRKFRWTGDVSGDSPRHKSMSRRKSFGRHGSNVQLLHDHLADNGEVVSSAPQHHQLQPEKQLQALRRSSLSSHQLVVADTPPPPEPSRTARRLSLSRETSAIPVPPPRHEELQPRLWAPARASLRASQPTVPAEAPKRRSLARPAGGDFRKLPAGAWAALHQRFHHKEEVDTHTGSSSSSSSACPGDFRSCGSALWTRIHSRFRPCLVAEVSASLVQEAMVVALAKLTMRIPSNDEGAMPVHPSDWDWRRCPDAFWNALYESFQEGNGSSAALTASQHEASESDAAPGAASDMLGDFRSCPREAWATIHELFREGQLPAEPPSFGADQEWHTAAAVESSAADQAEAPPEKLSTTFHLDLEAYEAACRAGAQVGVSDLLDDLLTDSIGVKAGEGAFECEEEAVPGEDEAPFFLSAGGMLLDDFEDGDEDLAALGLSDSMQAYLAATGALLPRSPRTVPSQQEAEESQAPAEITALPDPINIETPDARAAEFNASAETKEKELKQTPLDSIEREEITFSKAADEIEPSKCEEPVKANAEPEPEADVKEDNAAPAATVPASTEAILQARLDAKQVVMQVVLKCIFAMQAAKVLEAGKVSASGKQAAEKEVTAEESQASERTPTGPDSSSTDMEDVVESSPAVEAPSTEVADGSSSNATSSEKVKDEVQASVPTEKSGEEQTSPPPAERRGEPATSTAPESKRVPSAPKGNTSQRGTSKSSKAGPPAPPASEPPGKTGRPPLRGAATPRKPTVSPQAKQATPGPTSRSSGSKAAAQGSAAPKSSAAPPPAPRERTPLQRPRRAEASEEKMAGRQSQGSSSTAATSGKERRAPSSKPAVPASTSSKAAPPASKAQAKQLSRQRSSTPPRGRGEEQGSVKPPEPPAPQSTVPPPEESPAQQVHEAEPPQQQPPQPQTQSEQQLQQQQHALYQQQVHHYHAQHQHMQTQQQVLMCEVSDEQFQLLLQAGLLSGLQQPAHASEAYAWPSPGVSAPSASPGGAYGGWPSSAYQWPQSPADQSLFADHAQWQPQADLTPLRSRLQAAPLSTDTSAQSLQRYSELSSLPPQHAHRQQGLGRDASAKSVRAQDSVSSTAGSRGERAGRSPRRISQDSTSQGLVFFPTTGSLIEVAPPPGKNHSRRPSQQRVASDALVTQQDVDVGAEPGASETSEGVDLSSSAPAGSGFRSARVLRSGPKDPRHQLPPLSVANLSGTMPPAPLSARERRFQSGRDPRSRDSGLKMNTAQANPTKAWDVGSSPTCAANLQPFMAQPFLSKGSDSHLVFQGV
mmetsp:Transcript_34324/g.80304  ORF Transcript_34324/g.80304 Transcript_34324/m.80304 type:complete len:1585 (+) Transcript_34324:95-4849(+)